LGYFRGIAVVVVRFAALPGRSSGRSLFDRETAQSLGPITGKANMPAQKPHPIKRRDGVGRIDPRYARELLAKARETKNEDDQSEANFAFLKGSRPIDTLARELGETFVQTVTSGEESEVERRDELTTEEVGGPFVVTSADEEFAAGTDESNIAEALREPLPRTSKAEP
jgi:hypothetical protein